jgi:hypothetical protein
MLQTSNRLPGDSLAKSAAAGTLVLWINGRTEQGKNPECLKGDKSSYPEQTTSAGGTHRGRLREKGDGLKTAEARASATVNKSPAAAKRGSARKKN